VRALAKSLQIQAFAKPRLLQIAAYFGRRLGSPPGVPGGGMTGILAELSGIGARI